MASGFSKLLSGGIYYPNCQVCASSFTASGLATLVTGAYPQLHGIVADRWYDRKAIPHTVVKARADLLEASTLADEAVRTEDGRVDCRVYCVGLSEAQTALLAGQSGAQVFWMDVTGQFTTRGDAPEWLAKNKLPSPENFHDAKWYALGASEVVPPLPPLRTLTFDERKPEDFVALYRSSYFAQDAEFEFLRTLLTEEKLGRGNTTDFVFVSLGSMGLLGYETGSDSPLMQQMVLRLDLQIQKTLDTLVPKGGYNLVFAAAHGAPPEPPAARRAALTIGGESLARTINKSLSDWIEKTSGKNSYVEKYVYPFLYLKPDAVRQQNVGIRGARKLAGELALRQPGVAGYYTADGECSHGGEWRRRFENSFHEVRSGDVMLSYEMGAVEEFSVGRGVSYGSLYNYDTTVPLILYGAQFGKKLIERNIELIDVAPTIARAAGISLPSSATGRTLEEAFAEA
jgi:hypothetical protein